MCVLATHLESMTPVLHAIFAPFFLTLFLFCSGYVYKRKSGFKDFIRKKVSQLWIPWLILSLFNILTAQVISFNAHKSVWEELFWNFLQIRAKDDGMWFVAALFVAYIPFYFFVEWYNKKKNTAAFLTITFALSLISTIYMKFADPQDFLWGTPALPWHLEYMFQANFFMALGYVFREKWEVWFDTKNNWLIIALACLAYILLVYGGAIIRQDGVFEADPIPLTYIKQLLGIYIFVFFSKKIKPTRYTLYIGQNTLLCFGLHGKLFSAIQMVARKVAGNLYSQILSKVLYSSVFSILCAFFMSIVLIVPIWLINRYLPFVAGKRK